MTPESDVVLVTGAAGNLGRAVAGAFAAQGARLVLVDLQQQALDAAFGNLGEAHLRLAANLLDAQSARAASAAAITRFGRFDVLCNLAGGFRMGEAVHETSLETWQLMMDLNVRTLLGAVQAVVPQMLLQGSGRIVNVAAGAAQRGAAHMGAYAAAKSAVIRLTESMAAELGPRGLRVNCVLPSIIDTPENRAAMPDTDPGRWVAPADLAAVICFLASRQARAVHGAALPVTGLA